MEHYYVGFDAGTQSVKVVICNEKMECIASASKPTTLYYPNPGWVEMDVDEYLKLTKECMKLCTVQMKEKGLDIHCIKSIMGDGIICGIAGVDADGNAITPYINYLDSRTEEDVRYINQLDLDIWGRETGNAEASCMFPALIARWILKNNQEFQQNGVKFVHNAPYILAHLAGLKADDMFIDWGAMSGWGLGYRVYEKQWSEEQLDILGIKTSYMPRIVKPWDIIGTLTKEAAEETGLPEGIPICGGAGDTMQSMIGSGILEAGHAVDVAGTCAMFCVSTKGIIPELTKKGSGLIFNSGTLPDSYFYWGYIRTGGLALRWFKDQICKQEQDEGYYHLMSERAREVPAGCNGVLFLPYLTGGMGEQANACGCFLNMTLDTDQSVLWRSVLEAIGYDYMEITDVYRSAGVDLSRIAITEGGSRNDLWNQIKADMLNGDVVTLENAGGAVVMNCLFGAFAVKDIEDIHHKLENYLKIKKIYKPKAELTKTYREFYKVQKNLIKDDMKNVFASLEAIRK
ncbi:MAG: FGGY-family carbohydrate kinase [Lachnospiraceae bacterium]|nr:FGGY-family carbohydrate kinase [Lachnospiraceae bacterium]